MGLRFRTVVAAAAILALAAPSALADTSNSSNWAGYAVHRAGVSFKHVNALWREPSAKCKVGSAQYSAVWDGLGGYSETSNALEQIGTEVDCSPAGKVVSSAWYELVPAAARTIEFRVRPGDLVGASVTVEQQQVVVTLSNLTLHHSFTKTLHASTVDISSAEWIVEAPSDCVGPNACQTLPLADFGSTTFDLAGAVSSAGHAGAITDPAWDRTKIRLRPSGRHFIVNQGAAASTGAAAPSALGVEGRWFKVTYSGVSVQPTNPLVSRSKLHAGYIVHTGR